MNAHAISLLFVAGILLHGTAAAQSLDSVEEVAVQIRDHAFWQDTAPKELRALTTNYGARPAGSEAERSAAKWLADQWRNIGLQNVHLEIFPLTAWKRISEHGEIVRPVHQPLSLTLLGGSPSTPPEGIEASIVRFATFEELSQAPAGSLSGKIAFLDYQMPRLESGIGYPVASNGRIRGPGIAAKAGAIAFILRSAGTDRVRTPHTGATLYEGDYAPLPSFAVSTIDADQIDRMLALGEVRVKLVGESQTYPSRSQNVIGEIPGTSDANEVVLAGAHLDSWDLATGANDDGAGVAIITGAAKLIIDQKKQARRTIRLVAFGSEEVSQPFDPFYIFGAHAYAATHKAELDRHVIASESDLGSGRIIALDLPKALIDTPLSKSIQRVLLPIAIIVEPEPATDGGTDINPLKAAGVPVFLAKQDATSYFDTHHTARDTYDAVDQIGLRQNVAAWGALLWLFASTDAELRKTP